MNYLIKERNPHRLSIDIISKQKKHLMTPSTVDLKSKLIKLNRTITSPSIKNNQIKNGKRKLSLLKNNIQNTSENKPSKRILSKKEFDTYDESSTSNISSNAINNESFFINTYNMKKSYIDSSKNIQNKNWKQNIIINDINKENDKFICNKKYSVDILIKYHNSKSKENDNSIRNDIINNEIGKRCRHKQVKREIYINNNINQINKSFYAQKMKNIKNSENKKENELKKAQNITIPISKRIKDNLFNNKKKNQSLSDYCFIKNKNTKKNKIFISNNKDNIENIETNNNNFKNFNSFKRNTINFKIKRTKYSQNSNNNNNNNKINNSTIKYQNTSYLFGNRNYKINSKENINTFNNDNNKENIVSNNNNNNVTRKENDSTLYFDENELNENTLSISKGKIKIKNNKNEIMINKVLNFETGFNNVFNYFKMNNNDINILNKNRSTKNIQEKKESCSTVIDSLNNKEINDEENEYIKNIKNIIHNNLVYKKNNTKKIIHGKNISLQKSITDGVLDMAIGSKIIKNKNNYEENVIINPDYISSESNTNSLTINKEFMNRQKRIRNLNNNNNNPQNKKLKLLNRHQNKNMLYKIFSHENFLKIIFDFCKSDISLLNKICLISKIIYKKIKPLIYNKIYILINRYNSDEKSKNKIKKYFMNINSSLLKLSPAILRKKYTDLIFENNNIYDKEIKNDLTRTFPDNILFKYGNRYYNKLYHILTAYSNFNKNIGYVQGLNFLAAHIIYFFENEIDEFIFLDALINKFELDKILDNNLNNKFFEKKSEKINNFIKIKLPKLNKFLSELKLNLEFFTTNWILTLFSNSMDNKYIFIIWDFMLIFGWKFFKFFILNVLIISESDILYSTQNNITFIKKNIFKNNKFENNFKGLINNTMRMMLNDDNIV